MDGFQAPFALCQFTGEPIEKLCMRGILAHRSEIAAGGYDAKAEVGRPEAIDDHASCQRMIGPSEVTGESRAAAADGRIRATLAVDLVGAEKLRKSRCDGLFGFAI